MVSILDFLTKQVRISDSLTMQVWMFLTLALAIALITVVLVFSSKNIKKHKVAEQPKVEEKPEITADEASKQYFEIVNKDIDIPLSISPEAPIVKPAPKAETAPIAAEIAKKTEIEVKEEISAEVDDIVYIKEESMEKQIAGKFAIVNSSVGGFRYSLIANNGQLLYESRDYKSKNTCIDAVEKFCEAVKEGDFAVKKDKFDRYKFVLRPKNNANTIYIGESFKDRTGCLSNIESVKRFVFAASPIVDRTKSDFVAESAEYKVPEEIVNAAAKKIGMPGKWEIAELNDEDKPSFEYLLFANNGQLLYESKEYKSYASCKSGLFTFVDTVKNGYFIIDSDKAGRYKFVLRSNKAGSQAEYIGQFYRSLDSCQSSINSVYKFALISSTDYLA